MALSATHNILTRELWESASLKDILNAEMIPYGGLDNGRVSVSGEPIRLKPQQALGFGLALHELATNSVKYGALSSETGLLDVACLIDGDSANIVWTERGGPPVTTPDEAHGFGSKLLQRIVTYGLEGSIHYEWAPEGLIARLQVSAAKLAQ